MVVLFTNPNFINAIDPKSLIVWAADGVTTEFALNRSRSEMSEVYGLCIITVDHQLATNVHLGPLTGNGKHRVFIFDEPPAKGAISLHIVYPLDTGDDKR